MSGQPVAVYMKELSKLLSSFYLCCGPSLGVDRPGRPMAVIEKAFKILDHSLPREGKSNFDGVVKL